MISNIPPSVSLVDFELFNKSININEAYQGRIMLSKSMTENPIITLGYNDNAFSIEYAALHFDEPDKNQFAYRLLGFNEQWIYKNCGYSQVVLTIQRHKPPNPRLFSPPCLRLRYS